MTLMDLRTAEILFNVNLWHWRPIVEAIRSLRVLPEERVDDLHRRFVGQLTAEEARSVAAAIRSDLLPSLRDGERLLLDGSRAPQDGAFHRAPADRHKNYGTTRNALEAFVESCEVCAGFQVA